MNTEKHYVWNRKSPQVIKYFLPEWTNHSSPQSTWIVIEYQTWRGVAYVPALKMEFQDAMTLAIYEATNYLKKLMGIPENIGAITTGYQGQYQPTSDNLKGKFGFSDEPYFNSTFFKS